MSSKQKSFAYEYFTLTSDLKYCVCQRTINKDGKERMCDVEVKASVGTSPKSHAPTRIFNVEKHLGLSSS